MHRQTHTQRHNHRNPHPKVHPEKRAPSSWHGLCPGASALGRLSWRGAVLAGMLLMVGASACDRRTEAFIPADQEPQAPARPVRIPGLEQGRPQRGLPQGMPAPASVQNAQTAQSGESVQGTIRLAEGVGDAGSGVLFLIARSAGGGPPLAVKRLSAGPFPLRFEIGQGDVMLQGRRFEGDIVLTARLDRDGQPLTTLPGDLQGAAKGVIQPGTTDVEIVLQPMGG